MKHNYKKNIIYITPDVSTALRRWRETKKKNSFPLTSDEIFMTVLKRHDLYSAPDMVV